MDLEGTMAATAGPTGGKLAADGPGQLERGAVVGRFVLLGTLGAGGMEETPRGRYMGDASGGHPARHRDGYAHEGADQTGPLAPSFGIGDSDPSRDWGGTEHSLLALINSIAIVINKLLIVIQNTINAHPLRNFACNSLAVQL